MIQHLPLLACLLACKVEPAPAPPAGEPSGDNSVCGEGTWGNLVIDEQTIFVQAGASGDGSQEAPLGTIAEALELAAASGRSRLAVAGGDYVETLVIGPEHTGIELSGRCAEQVRIDGSASPEDGDGAWLPVVDVAMEEGQTFTLSGLGIQNGLYQGLRVRGGQVIGQHLDITGNHTRGVRVTGTDAPAHLDLSDSSVSDNLVDLRVGTIYENSGGGIQVEYGGTATFTDLLVDRNPNFGIGVWDPGDGVDISRVELNGSLATAFSELAVGLFVDQDALVRAQDIVIRGTEGPAMSVGGYYGGGRVELTRGVIEDNLPSPFNGYGGGAWIEEDATFADLDSVFQRNPDTAIRIIGSGGSAELVGTTIADPFLVEADPLSFGMGITVVSGGSLLASEITIQRANHAGILASGATVDVASSTIEDTIGGWLPDYDEAGEPTGTSTWVGAGVQVEKGTVLTLSQSTLRGGSFRELSLADSQSTLENVEISGTRSDDSPTGGAGLWVGGGTLDAVGLDISDVDYLGLVLVLGAVATVEDLVVYAVNPWSESSGPIAEDGVAAGIHLDSGPSLTLRGADISFTPTIGISAGRGASLSMEDVNILECTPVEGSVRAGVGAMFTGGSVVEARGLAIDGCETFGLFVEAAAEDDAETPWDETATRATVQDLTMTRIGEENVTTDTVGLVFDGPVEVSLRSAMIDVVRGTGIWTAHGAQVDLVDVSVGGIMAPYAAQAGVGLLVAEGAEVEASELVVGGAEGPGVLLTGDCGEAIDCPDGTGGRLHCTGCDIVDNAFAGVEVVLGELDMDGGQISSTDAHSTIDGGAGLLIWGLAISPPSVRLANFEITTSARTGVLVGGPADVRLEGCSIEVGLDAGGPVPSATAVLALQGSQTWDEATGSGVLLSGNRFGSGGEPTVLASAASLSLDGNTWPEDGKLVQQQCSAEIPTPVGIEEVPTVELCPATDERITESEFIWVPELLVPGLQLPELGG